MYKYKLKPFTTTIESLIHPKGWLPNYLYSVKWLDELHIQIGLNFSINDYAIKCTLELFGTKTNNKYIRFNRYASNNTRTTILKHNLLNKAKSLIQKSKDLWKNHRKISKCTISDIIQHLALNTEFQIIDESETNLTLQYNDAYDKEIVSIERTLNHFNVPQYDLVIRLIQFDDEIVSPYSCHECSEECTFYDIPHNKCHKTDLAIDKEVESFESKKPLSIDNNNRTLFHISNSVYTERCIIDIPHHHLYKSTVLKVLNTTDKQLIINCINTRELLKEIWKNI